MRITYRTLGELIKLMNDFQLDCDVTVVEGKECFPAELRIADKFEEGLDEGHPFLLVDFHPYEDDIRCDNVIHIAKDIGLNNRRS